MAAQYAPRVCSVAPSRERAGWHLLLAGGELGLKSWETLGEESDTSNVMAIFGLPWVAPISKSCWCFVPFVSSIQSKIWLNSDQFHPCHPCAVPRPHSRLVRLAWEVVVAQAVLDHGLHALLGLGQHRQTLHQVGLSPGAQLLRRWPSDVALPG